MKPRCPLHVNTEMREEQFTRTLHSAKGTEHEQVKSYRCPIAGCPRVEAAQNHYEVTDFDRKYKEHFRERYEAD